MLRGLVLVAACLLAVSNAQPAQPVFTCDLSVHGIPGTSPTARFNGKFYYVSSTATDTHKWAIEWDLGQPNSPTEVVDFNEGVRYVHCTDCEAESMGTQQPKLFYNASQPAANPATLANGCVGKTDAQGYGGLTQVYFDGTTGLPCQAEFSNGKIFEFSNCAASVNQAKLDVSSWNCPQKQCSTQIDIMMVLDESGSVASADFERMRAWAINFTNQFTFSASTPTGDTGVTMGVVMFSSGSRVIINLNKDGNSVRNAIANIRKSGGSTCIPCGIQDAHTSFSSYSTRPKVGRVMITLTDGQNNVRVGQVITEADSAKADNIMMFAIGVGGGFNPATLAEIASVIPGVTTIFELTGGFNDLKGILDNLISQVCMDFPTNPCGARCAGFCSCHGQCVCPSSCSDGNFCTLDQCDNATATSSFGCQYVPKPTSACDDNDPCTNDNCDPATDQCVHVARNCEQEARNLGLWKACYDYQCVVGVGCDFTVDACDDGDVCTTDTCTNSATKACDHALDTRCACRNTICVDDQCRDMECNQATGLCEDVGPVMCPPNASNPCMIGYCDPNTNMCGTQPKACDDNDPCTVDSCEQGACVFTTVNCTGSFSGHEGDWCNEAVCDTGSTCNPNTDKFCACKYTPLPVGKNAGEICKAKLEDPDTLPCQTVFCLYDATAKDSSCERTQGTDECQNDPRFKDMSGACAYPECGKRGCYIRDQCADQPPGKCNVAITECGDCYEKDSEKAPYCALAPPVPWGVAGAVIALIIILILIGLALLAFGGVKGYQYYKNQRGNMEGVQESPLYEAGNNTGENPLFEG